MSTKKSRDLAQELVDFLLKEEKQNKGVAPALAHEKNENRPKPQLVSPFPAKPVSAPVPASASQSVSASGLPPVPTPAPARPPKEKSVVFAVEPLPSLGGDKTLQLNDEKPTFEQPTFISSVDVSLPEPQKKDPRHPELEKTEVQHVAITADLPPLINLQKEVAPTAAKEPDKNGFTAIEFSVGQEDAAQAEVNFVNTSEKAKEILSDTTPKPAVGGAKPALKADAKPELKTELSVRLGSLNEPAEKVELRANIPQGADAKDPTQSGKSQVFSSQRSRIVVNEVTQLMAGAEAVKVAQARITSLEGERDELRSECEELLSATETLQRRYNELKAQHDALERKHKERIEILEDEKAVIRARLGAKEEELDRIRKENDDLQLRFKNDLRKIRVRERELEHRQEIMKAEHATVVQSKDEMIIELKRTLERLHFELDNFRAKSADMNTKINEFYERNHRTVKALRLALSVLETGDNEEKPKKASG